VDRLRRQPHLGSREHLFAAAVGSWFGRERRHPIPGSPSCAAGLTYARFRLSRAGNLPPTGPADDGEVEDYPVLIRQPALTLSDELVITDIDVSSNTVRIVWHSSSNRVHQLERSSSPRAAIAWTGVGSQVIGPASQQVDHVAGNTGHYYRVTLPYVE